MVKDQSCISRAVSPARGWKCVHAFTDWPSTLKKPVKGLPQHLRQHGCLYKLTHREERILASLERLLGWALEYSRYSKQGAHGELAFHYPLLSFSRHLLQSTCRKDGASLVNPFHVEPKDRARLVLAAALAQGVTSPPSFLVLTCSTPKTVWYLKFGFQAS